MTDSREMPLAGGEEGELSVAGPPRSRNLVFTSAGDRSNVARWLAGSPEFDVWVTYYGDSDPGLQRDVHYFNRHKGSKYQNLYHAWRTWPELLRQYDAVFVADDDILISTEQINRLFEFRSQLDLWVCQPAFDPRGKVSHPHTRAHGGVRYKLTNFVENNVPLFRADKLWQFLDQFDESVTCWGIDWWYTEILELSVSGRAAVIDEIVCLNPLDRTKGGKRELDRLHPLLQRVRRWEKLRDARGLRGESIGKSVYESFPLEGTHYLISMLRAAVTLVIGFPRRCGQKGNNQLRSARGWAAWTRSPRRT